MARISATASLGLRVGLGGKQKFQSHDAASPHHSLTIEREVSDAHTDEELLEKAEKLHSQCEARVNQYMDTELKKIRDMP